VRHTVPPEYTVQWTPVVPVVVPEMSFTAVVDVAMNV
jgi:hypothetical protein